MHNHKCTRRHADEVQFFSLSFDSIALAIAFEGSTYFNGLGLKGCILKTRYGTRSTPTTEKGGVCEKDFDVMA